MICAAREHPMTCESPAKGICAECYDRLPAHTRHLYATGQLSIRRVGELARSRNMTCKQIGAGRFTRHDARKAGSR